MAELFDPVQDGLESTASADEPACGPTPTSPWTPTGCRSFSNAWLETEHATLPTTVAVRDDSPNVAAEGANLRRGVVDQDNHLLSTLGDGSRLEVDGQRMTRVSRDGLDLTYRSARN